MKYNLKFLMLFLFSLTLSLFISSCEKKNDDPNNPNNPNPNPNPNPHGEDCFEFNDLSSLIGGAKYTQFINEDLGWMVANDVNYDNRALFKTVDGGANWELINDDINVAMGGQIRPILKFVNATNGFKLSVVSFQSVVSYTTDGGVTWSNYDNPDLNQTFLWSALAYNSQETVFIDDVSTVMVVNNTTMEVTNVVEMPDFLFVDSYHLWGGDFHLSESGVITCVLFGGDNENNYIAQSSDYGATWTFPETIANKYVKSMSWPSDQVGYINIGSNTGDENSEMYVTTDGGLTWESKASPEFIDISFADNNTGLGISYSSYNPLVLYEKGLYKTEDGGDTWTLFDCLSAENGTSENTGLCISYLSPDNAWVSGSQYDADNDVYFYGLYHYQGE